MNNPIHIHRNEYLQIIGLLALASQYRETVQDIQGALAKWLHVEPRGHGSDAIGEGYDADRLLELLLASGDIQEMPPHPITLSVAGLLILGQGYERKLRGIHNELREMVRYPGDTQAPTSVPWEDAVLDAVWGEYDADHLLEELGIEIPEEP